jgi:metal-responsive CopG/Arc/MetJ family transcriptional regulator
VNDELTLMPRIRTSISLDEDLLKQINKHVEENYQYRDRSHFFEILARKYFESLNDVK